MLCRLAYNGFKRQFEYVAAPRNQLSSLVHKGLLGMSRPFCFGFQQPNGHPLTFNLPSDPSSCLLKDLSGIDQVPMLVPWVQDRSCSNDLGPFQSKTAEVLPKSVGIVCAGLTGPGSAEQLTAGLRDRTRLATNTNHIFELNAIE